MTALRTTHGNNLDISHVCELFGKTKQAYYKRRGNVEMSTTFRRDIALDFIREVRSHDPGIGGRKIWTIYRREFTGDHPLGRDKFCDILSESGLTIRRRTRKPRTTDSTHGLPTYPNLVKSFVPTASNQLWVSDITYILLGNPDGSYRFCYLTLVLDGYSEEILGWCVGETLDTKYPLEALRMALRRFKSKIGDKSLIHHTDRGVQYASAAYVSLLQKYRIRISMTENGDPKENAQAERINNTMKNELLKGMHFTNISEVQAAVGKAVEFYNNRRPHKSIGMQTPAEATGSTGERDLRWHSWRQEAIKKLADQGLITEKGLPLRPESTKATGPAA